MFQRYVAGLCLIPASFVVYGTMREWWDAALRGYYYFFSTIVKSVPTQMCRGKSLFYNALVYYPAKIGVELVRGGTVKSVAKKIWYKLGRKMWGMENPPPPGPAVEFRHREVDFLAPERIKAMIQDSAIKVVSFDIFDTLLVRPVMHPKDIFYVVAKKVDAEHGVNFVRMRWDAEARLNNPHATLRDIYEYMDRAFALAPGVADALLAEEIRCEATLLSPRADVAEMYAEAVNAGKRIIAVSDMYLPSDVLTDILRKKGYAEVAAVYVSCEHGARKSDGGLYAAVLAAECVHPSEILHIGDNCQSDYVKALEKKITAVHYPSVLERCFRNSPIYEMFFAEGVRRDPFWGMLLGFSLNRMFGGPNPPPAHVLDMKDMRQFADLVMAPLTTGFCLSLANNARLQQKHQRIYFASRDGYLPEKVYAIVRKYVPCIPGVYFYAGRRAYYPCLYTSFFDYMDSLQKVSNPEEYTLNDFLKAHFEGTPLFESMSAELSEKEKSLLLFKNKPEGAWILRRFSEAIETCMEERRAQIKKYYASVFSGEKDRCLVFDLGYSGSIGKALHTITGKIIDKVYFWEAPPNKLLDKEQGSKTWVFMKRNDYGYAPYNMLLEELFSPCEGGAIGFDGQGRAQFETMPASQALQADIDTVHTSCESFAEEFCALWGDYAQYVTLREPDVAIDLCRAVLNGVPFCNNRLFRNIIFPDPVYHSEGASLEKKMESHMLRKNVFCGTGFDNPNHMLTPAPRVAVEHGPIGIHLHLYNMDLAHEIVCYLQDFPVPFDLFITIVDGEWARTVQNVFSRGAMPNAQAVTVLTVPNRGRDVAPWVLDMRPYQGQYDLFCHIHTKKSEHILFGDQWRRYLFDNLLRADAVAQIMAAFHENPQLGGLFPAIYGKLRRVMVDVGVPLHGSEKELGLIRNLLSRMGLGEHFARSDLFFAAGTMLWYRPKALEQLFSVDLQREEFAEEPIGIDGTLAHAIERLPAVVCAKNGYLARNLTLHT